MVLTSRSGVQPRISDFFPQPVGTEVIYIAEQTADSLSQSDEAALRDARLVSPTRVTAGLMPTEFPEKQRKDNEPALVLVPRELAPAPLLLTKKPMSGNLDWCSAYRPLTAEDVFGNSEQIQQLCDWLERKSLWPQRKRKRRDLDNDTDDVTVGGVCLVYGPGGCGKSAGVYAAASVCGFEVFEINPGTRRINDIAEVGSVGSNLILGGHSRALILMDDADVLCEHDSGLWSAIGAMAKASNRPIVVTMTDPRLATNFRAQFHPEVSIQLQMPPNIADYLYSLLYSRNIFVSIASLISVARCQKTLSGAIRAVEFLSKSIPTESKSQTLPSPSISDIARVSDVLSCNLGSDYAETLCYKHIPAHPAVCSDYINTFEPCLVQLGRFPAWKYGNLDLLAFVSNISELQARLMHSAALRSSRSLRKAARSSHLGLNARQTDDIAAFRLK